MRPRAFLTWFGLSVALTGNAACLDSQYIGFDSRVSVRLLGRLPVTDEPVNGFAAAGRSVVVLLKSRLLIYDGSVPREIELPYSASGLSVDAEERVRVQHDTAVDLLSDSGLTPDPSFSPSGRLFGSGRPVLLDVYDEEGVQKLALLRAGGDTFGLAGAHGVLRAAFWGDAGMAAVVGQSLYAWADESKELQRLAIDKGLANARGVCLIGPGRAVVALPRALVVISDEDEIVLAGMTAKCDTRHGTLFLIDERTGQIWSVTGVDKLGNFRNDDQHARSLILGLPSRAGEDAPAFLEAARIIGCDQARKLLAERPTK